VLITGLETEIEAELALVQANAAPPSPGGMHTFQQTTSTRSVSAAGYSGYAVANGDEVAHASGGGGAGAAVVGKNTSRSPGAHNFAAYSTGDASNAYASIPAQPAARPGDVVYNSNSQPVVGTVGGGGGGSAASSNSTAVASPAGYKQVVPKRLRVAAGGDGGHPQQHVGENRLSTEQSRAAQGRGTPLTTAGNTTTTRASGQNMHVQQQQTTAERRAQSQAPAQTIGPVGGAAAAVEMQPIEHAPSDVGAGYLDIDTNDPSNASEVPATNGTAGHEREGERGEREGGGAPRQGKGIKRDMRKPSVYEGFGAADEETRL
jgi:hypothetical protein